MAEIKIQPLGKRILVKPKEEEETIAGGKERKFNILQEVFS